MKKLITMTLLTLSLVLCLGACGEVDDSPIESGEIGNLYSNADEFKGRTFEFTAKVFDVEKKDDMYYIQAWYEKANNDKNTIIIWKDTSQTITYDNYVRVKGTIEGKNVGKNAFGNDAEAVCVRAESVEVINAVEAYPATRTVDVDKTIKKGNYKVTLQKVDWTDNETRLYIKVENTGSTSISLYAGVGVVIQNGRQYETEYNYEYPEVSSDLKGGASSEGVVTYKKLEETDFTYSFEGFDDNFNELEFKFNVNVE